MQDRAVGIVEPIARIQRKKLQFGALRQIRRLINDQPPGPDTRLESHDDSLVSRGLVVEPVEVGGGGRGAAVARRVEADHRAGEVILAVFADLLGREGACR